MSPVLQAFQMNRREELQDGVRRHLAKLHQQLLSGAVLEKRRKRMEARSAFAESRLRAK